MSSVKINKLEIENVKRVRAVKVEPTASGLTIIGGRNNQGKTSVLDSIAWVLGGNKFRPSKPQREGSMIPPNLKIILDNGIVVERKGKNSDLKVTDPSGKKAGQQLLDSFISQLALDLPKFMEASGKEKAQTLLQIIGIGEQLALMEKEEMELYNERLAIGRISDQKEKYAKEQPYYPDVPKNLISVSELIRQQQEILAKNGENQRKRENLHQLEQQYQRINDQLEDLLRQQNQIQKDLNIARMDAVDLHDESTAELEKNISDIEEINRKIRANLDKEKAEDDAKEYKNQYLSLSGKISEIRTEKMELLKSADLPLPDLAVEDGELIYHGQKWDNMSGSDQLKVSTAIVRKLNPNCGFVLLDKLEQMDLETMKEFGHWLEEEGLQAIATRVSTGEECSIIIEDGYVTSGSEAPKREDPVEAKVNWKEGDF
ncbi:MAG: AAA family ATPase [Clostridiales bacterium]|nr:AAA family ATPase [Clostridiales bacterium]